MIWERFAVAMRICFFTIIKQFNISNYINYDTKRATRQIENYAIEIVKFAESLSDTLCFRTVRNQIVRCGPSAAANYRAACRGKSTADFKYKLEIVEEELDETMFWLEFTVGLDESKRSLVSSLWKEGNELLSIIVSSINSVKKKFKKE